MRVERIKIRGRGEFGDVASLLRRIRRLLTTGLLDFESVRLGEVRGRTVSLDDTVAMACYDHDSKAMEVAYGRVLGSPKFVFAMNPGANLLGASVGAVAAGRVTLRTTGGRDVVVVLP